jgi:NAD(P)-dependent dehydrogenase (short-subunit alcohol dehydrogenase family)
MQQLKGQIAVVTGASRGVGRGIAQVLGEAGATVYVTGRSIPGATSFDKAETVQQTAQMVTDRGGQGIAVQVDHTVDEQVIAFFERVEREQGRLDILVNNVWGGYENYDDAAFMGNFWEQPIWRLDKMYHAGIRAHYTATRCAAPLMMAQKRGLIINTTFWDQDKYLGNLLYDIAKMAINRMMYGVALELRDYNIAALALSPGFTRTEAILAAFNVTEDTWHTVDDMQRTESPQYIGRAVAALAADPDVMLKSGKVLAVGDLAEEYDFTDIDGRRIPAFHID